MPEIQTGPCTTTPSPTTCIMAYSALCGLCPAYFAASLVSSTARPLYSPHLGQARWGSFFSWQFGHSETPVWVRKSWARRLELRRDEWRLFGFGMVLVLSHFHPIGTALGPICISAGAERLKINDLWTLSCCATLKAPPSEDPSDPHRRSIHGCCGSDRSAGKVLCSQPCTAS